ncbi:uncharacterized protein LOC143626983 [Bidens hawaiensis]|uniref:uncharacterized protein LOC143626983 n=1 Tax=Bidens hawaiensis TaxID=980011 RepID=UPI0040495387
MALIQQGVADQLFSRIAGTSTAKETWDTLRIEFQGDSQVKSVKLQGLRRDFENIQMKNGEMIGDYFSRVMSIVSQQQAYGEAVTDKKIVEKVLRSLSPKFDYVVPSIEVSLDLSTLTPVKLMGSLQSQEERMLGINEEDKADLKNDEQALQAMQNARRSPADWGRGGGQFRGRGRGRFGERGRGPQCHLYKRFGHYKKDCWFNKEEQHANLADQEDEQPRNEDKMLFVACIDGGDRCSQDFMLVANTESHTTNAP